MNERGERKWTRRIMNTYWLVIGIHLLAQTAVILFLEPVYTGMYFVMRNIVIPTAVMSAVVAAAEGLYRAKHRFLPYYLSMAGAIMSATAAYVSFDVRMIPATFLLTIVASILFFNRRLTVYCASFQLVAYFSVYAASASFRAELKPYDVLTFVCLVIADTLITLAIAYKGKELLEELSQSFRDREELYVQNERISELARTDPLTQLPNRAAFDAAFERMMKEGKKVTLALLDLDNFKSINDTYGHVVGDSVLIRAASVLRDSCYHHAFAARLGGEEFAILLPGGDQASNIAMLDTIRSHMESLPMPEMPGRSVTVTIGASLCLPGMTKEACLAKADNLLYEGKRTGKNKVVSD